MRGMRRFVALFVMSFVVASVLGSTGATARPAIKVLLSGLSSPKGLALSPDGDLAVGQGAFGPPGPVLLYVLTGHDHGSTIELTGPENFVDVAAGPDGSGWAVGGDGRLYRQDTSGVLEEILDIIAYQAGDPDPFDIEGNDTESNPFGLAILPSGDALVADAAGNDLLRVTPAGEATTVARFDVEAVSTDHLPPEPGLEPTVDSEAVPTSVTVGPDGSAYVGELQGVPFRPGTSHVWRIDPSADGAVCSVVTPDPDCSVYAEGFTAVVDIAFNQRTAALFVYELAEDGVAAFEEGFGTGDFPPAVLLKVKRGRRTQLAEGLLSQPGGIVVRPGGGRVYATDGMFSDGRLVRIRG